MQLVARQREEWRDLPGFEGVIRVSSWGRVLNLRTGKPPEHRLDRGLYLAFRSMRDGKRCVIKVHRAVCTAFHGPPPPDKPWALHRNGKHQDNFATNLYWGTPAENQADCIRHGNRPLETKTSKLTAEEAAMIRTDAWLPLRVLAKRFDVTEATVSRIIAGKTWKLEHAGE